jgi:DNA polymerase zeta
MIVGPYIHRLHLSIDFALAVSYRRNVYDGKSKFVARITLVKGIPFYGFHVGYRFFLKIYMLNPMVMTRLADLLRQGVIMKKVFQPYEAHLQYLLQWMSDYNLYGCGYIDCKKVMFRSPIPSYEELGHPSHLWHDRSIPDELIIGAADLPRVSHCSIEVDICVQDIMNRHEIKPRSLHHDFIERLNPLAPGERLVHSMAGLWRDETRRRKSKMPNPDPGSSPFPAEVMISMSADPRNSQVGGWIHEEEYKEKVMSLVLDEKNKSDGSKISFKNYVRSMPFESTIKTSLEAVEDLFPENLRPVLGLAPGTGANYDTNDTDDKEVDEKRILGLQPDDDENCLYDSDEEVMREMELSQRRKGDRVDERLAELEAPIKPEQGLDQEGWPDEESAKPPTIDSADGDVTRDPASSFHSSTDGASSYPSSDVSSSLYIFPPSLSMIQPLDATTVNSVRNLKRAEASIEQETVNTKRQKVSFGVVYDSESDASKKMLEHAFESNRQAEMRNSEPPLQAELSTEVKNIEPEQLSNPKPIISGPPRITTGVTRRNSSQELLKANQQSQTPSLKFAVVKDPNHPETILRLSQKTEPLPNHTEKKKNRVSFAPSVSISTHLSGPLQPTSSDMSTLDMPNPVRSVLVNMQTEFRKTDGGIVLALKDHPPAPALVVSSMQRFRLPQIIHQDAFYSKEIDVPDRAREWAGREFKLESLSTPFLPEFDPTGTSAATFGEKPPIVPDRVKEEKLHERRRSICTLLSWQLTEPPPTYANVEEWLRVEQAEKLASAARSHHAKTTRLYPQVKDN